MSSGPLKDSLGRKTKAGDSRSQRGGIEPAPRIAGWTAAVYALFLGGWMLTLFRQTDPRLVLDRVVRLSLLGIDVPLNIFFFAAPLMGLLLFFIVRLRSGRVGVSSFKGASARPGPRFPKPLRVILGALFWVSLPIVLIYHLLRHIRVHDFSAAYVLGGIIIAETIAVAGVWWGSRGRRQGVSRMKTMAACSMILLGLAFQTVIVIDLIPWAQWGYYRGAFFPRLLKSSLQPQISVELSGLDLARDVRNAFRHTPGLGQGLRGIHLEGARLNKVSAERADLLSASLKAAVLNSCTMEGMNIRAADLRETNFLFSRIARADFTSAVLQGAIFLACDMKGVCVRDAVLQYSKWLFCDARGADLHMTDFRAQGIFFGTNFEEADLEGASLRSCEVMKNDFSRANLKDINLAGSYLWHSDFSGTDLEGANFLGAIDLDAEQLAKAKTLYRAKLDPPLYEEIKKKYPKLLEKPDQPGTR